MTYTYNIFIFNSERKLACDRKDVDDPTKVCGQRFFRKQELEDHKLFVHDKKKHKCGTCQKEFTSAMGLRKHVLIIHEKKPKYHCGRCSREEGDADYWQGTMGIGDYISHLLAKHQEDKETHPDIKKHCTVHICVKKPCRKMLFSKYIAVSSSFRRRFVTVSLFIVSSSFRHCFVVVSSLFLFQLQVPRLTDFIDVWKESSGTTAWIARRVIRPRKTWMNTTRLFTTMSAPSAGGSLRPSTMFSNTCRPASSKNRR